MDTVVRWADTQWLGLPRRLMLRFPSLRGLAGDGHVVVTLPMLAAVLPGAVLLLGLVSGLLRLGYDDVYTESVVLLTVLVALGFFSSQLGVLVVVGFCVGDFLTAPRYEGTGYSSSIWFSGILGEGPLATVAHGWLPRLITYLLLAAVVILLPRAARAVVHTVGRARRMPALLAWGLVSALLVVIAWLGTDAWVAGAPTLVRPLFTWGSYNGTPTVAAIATLQETGGVVVAAAVIATVLRQLWLGAAMVPGVVQDRLRAAEDGEGGATPAERKTAAQAGPEAAADLLAKVRFPAPPGTTRRLSGAVALSLLATLTLAGILEQLWLWFAAFGVLLAVRLLRTTPQHLPWLERWRRVAAVLPAWARLIALWLLSRMVVEAISNDVIGSYTALSIFVLGSIVVVFAVFPGEPRPDDDGRLGPGDGDGGAGSGDETAMPGGAVPDERRTDGPSSPDPAPGSGTASGTVQRAATGVVSIAPPALLAPWWCQRLRVLQLVVATWTVTALVGLFTAAPASADNCSVFADCYGVTNSAAEAAFGLALLAALSMVLDFIPVIGTAKGAIEAITGRDLLTGHELAWWERALGVVPILAGLGVLSVTTRAVTRNTPTPPHVPRNSPSTSNPPPPRTTTPDVPPPRTTTPSRNPDLDATPGGQRTTIQPKEDPDTVRSLTRENESADTLARHGYEVKQNPIVSGNKNPDYLIEGEVFDNIAPKGETSPRNIWSRVEEKVLEGQTERVVLNLDDTAVSLDALRDQFNKWEILGLKEVIVVRGGDVIRLVP